MADGRGPQGRRHRLELAQAAQRRLRWAASTTGTSRRQTYTSRPSSGKGTGRARAGRGVERQIRARRRHLFVLASFAEVEVDMETGKYYITDFLAYADVGTVLHPHALGGQVLGRSTLGIAHAIGQKWVIDPRVWIYSKAATVYCGSMTHF